MSRSGLVVSAFLVAGVVGTPAAFAGKSEKRVEKKADKKSDQKSDKKSDKKSSAATKSSKASGKKSGGGGGGGGKTATKTAKRDTKSGGKSARKGGASTRTLSRAVTARTKMDAGPTGFTWPPSQKMLDAEKACEARLDLAGVAWQPVERDGRMVAAIVSDMNFGGVRFMDAWGRKGPHKLDCQLAVALEAVGHDLYALGVREAHFASLYRWSNVRAFGKTVNVLSRHSYGLAMDVVSFRDAAGRAVNVAKDYPKKDALLLDIEKTINDSKKFRLLLTPRNDPTSHSDHYHFEAVSNYTAKAPEQAPPAVAEPDGDGE
ncbi:MAG: extensin family protein [Deltaproteobacteria bacterium]|nr:extensin family protein [Deltaproteobacteria bacterium]